MLGGGAAALLAGPADDTFIQLSGLGAATAIGRGRDSSACNWESKLASGELSSGSVVASTRAIAACEWRTTGLEPPSSIRNAGLFSPPTKAVAGLRRLLVCWAGGCGIPGRGMADAGTIGASGCWALEKSPRSVIAAAARNTAAHHEARMRFNC